MATTWVFERDGERLRVQRQDVLGELRLVIWGTEVADRVQVFDDEVQLVACMTALDEHLVSAGWSLVDFFPERRAALRPPTGTTGPLRDTHGRLSSYTGGSHDAAGHASIDLIRS